MATIFTLLRTALMDSLTLFWELLKVMVPIMILVKLAVDFGIIDYIALVFEPIMGWVGLPASLGIAWVTAMVVNLYAGSAVVLALLPSLDLTAAQATVLGSLFLIAHSLPIEQRIVQKAGASLIFTTLFRIGGALVYGVLLHQFYQATDMLQDPAVVVMAMDSGTAADFTNQPWGAWALDNAASLVWIYAIILALIVLLKIFDLTGITALLTKALTPILGLCGISGRAMPLTMPGVLLGISYGGALIIREAKAGTMSQKDIFLSLAFLSLCHSLIEDTLFIMALGAHYSGIVIGRFLFTMVLVWLLAKSIDLFSEERLGKLFYSRG